MQIQYRANGMKRNVSECVGNALIARRIAVAVESVKPESSGDYARADMQPEQREELSPRTGKPKRRYKRRDMQAAE